MRRFGWAAIPGEVAQDAAGGVARTGVPQRRDNRHPAPPFQETHRLQGCECLQHVAAGWTCLPETTPPTTHHLTGRCRSAVGNYSVFEKTAAERLRNARSKIEAQEAHKKHIQASRCIWARNTLSLPVSTRSGAFPDCVPVLTSVCWGGGGGGGGGIGSSAGGCDQNSRPRASGSLQ